MTGNVSRIAMTMGDPAGIGPEVIVRSWSQPSLHATAHLVAVGSPAVFREAARRWSPDLQIVEGWVPPPAASPALLPVIAAKDIAFPDVAVGQVSALAGEASYQAVVKATQMVLAGALDGLVTCPINKAAWHAAGHQVPGHTELLGELCGHMPSAMMLYLPPGAGAGPGGLGVVHVTLHCSVRQALEQIRTPRIVLYGRLLHQTLSKLRASASGRDAPRLGVCALNPHAGENGLFGDEEIHVIAPAVSQLVAAGVDAIGPLPADTLLARAVSGDFDGVVAMLHDQGHIALKLLNMHGAVNVTLGLPIARTSVAHGTAFDIAWQGRARVDGLLAAVRTCARLTGRT